MDQSTDAAALRTAGEASTSAAGPSTDASSSSKDKPIVVLIIGEEAALQSWPAPLQPPRLSYSSYLELPHQSQMPSDVMMMM
jgi:hypothetical protein